MIKVSFRSKFNPTYICFSFLLFLSGCGSLTVDMSTMEGLEPYPFSEASFVEGKYRFGTGGSKFFEGKINQAITERRYEDALLALVSHDYASDQSYYNLGLIAEHQGHHQAASIYYDLASKLNQSDNPILSRCPQNDEETNWIYYEYSCFMLTSQDMDSASRRNRLKAEGEWLDTVIEYEDGKIYIGEVGEDGLPHGRGELTSPSGEFFMGQFSGGLQSGAGTLSVKTPSSTLYFRGIFDLGKPKIGYLYNPAMKTMGVPFGHEMTFKDGGFYYKSAGWFDLDEPLGSRAADNNYWFSGSWSEAFSSALSQIFANGGTAPIFSSDPLIKRVCEVESELISSGVKKDELCD